MPSAGVGPVPEGSKSFVVTWILSYVLGLFGADRFYLGKTGTAIAKLLTFGGLGVWWLADLVITLVGAQRDNRGLRLAGYEQHKKLAWIVSGALVLVGLILNIVAPKPVAPIAPKALTSQATQAPVAVTSPEATTQPVAQPTPEAPAAETPPTAQPAPTAEAPKAPAVPAEFKSALRKAESYSSRMHMSRAGIYDQLTSEYGEKFSAEAATYAMDNLVADYNANALAKAKSYQDTMAMSPDAIYDQLISEYGEQFTPEEADYAIANLNG